jgi:hypothetical protein
VILATVVTMATLDAASARQPGEQAWIVEERSTPEQVTVVVPRHVGAPPLDADAFHVVVDGEEHSAVTSRPVDEGLDLVVLVDSGRLDDHLLPAKGAAAELLLQLPESVRVVVWGASAAAPPPDVAPVPAADAITAVGAIQSAPPGDLGATLDALAGVLDPARRHAAVVVTPAGEHTETLSQALDDYAAGIELVDVPASVPPGGQHILAALDRYALELPGTYEVATQVRGEIEAVLVAFDDGVVRLDMPGQEAPPPTAAGTERALDSETTVTTTARVVSAPPLTPATLPPLSVELSTQVRPEQQQEMLGMAAIGVAALLTVALVGLLFIRLRRARRAAQVEVDDADAATPATLAELYGLHPDGTTASASRLLCVVELAAASRLDGEAIGLVEIRAALDGRGDSDLRRWVDVLHTSLLLRSRRPLDDRLRAALGQLGARSDLAAASGRVAGETDEPSELHRGLFEVGQPQRFGHRVAALGLALLDPFGTRPAPLAVTPFLSSGPDDIATAVLRATSWHETVKRRMLSRLLEPTSSAYGGRDEDPAQLVTGMLDKFLPTPAAH